MGADVNGAFVRHRGPVTCAAGVLRSGKVLTSGYDGAVGLCDLATGQAELVGYHEHLVNRITVNESGTRAASSSSDYTIILWDWKKRVPERVLRGHSDDVEDFVFVSDSTGASVSRDWRVLVWDLRHGSIVRVLEGHAADVLSVNYHDGKLFTSGDDMTLRIWDLETGRLLQKWGPFDSETDTCAIDGLHGQVVLGCDDGVVRTFDVGTGAAVHEIQAHASGVKKVAVSPANGDILSAAYDQKLLVWDAVTGENKVSLAGCPSVWERSLNWSPDGATVLGGTFDGTVVAWAGGTGQLLGEFGVGTGPRGNACFNDVCAPGRGEVALVSDDGYVRLGRLTPAEAGWVGQTEPASGRVLMNAITCDEAGDRVLTGGHDRKLRIFRRTGDGLVQEAEVLIGEGPINTVRVAAHPGFEGLSFVGCYSGAIVRVTREGRIHGSFRVHNNAVKALRLHPRQCLGVSCSADGVLASWEFGGQLVRHFPGHMGIIDDVDLDPSGTWLASVGRDFTLKVYRLDDGQLCQSISLGRRSPKAVCFVDEATVVVTNYWGELLKVTLPNRRVYRRQIARNGISSITRSGRYLAASSYDGAVYLVRPEDLAVEQTLRAMTQRVDGGAWD